MTRPKVLTDKSLHCWNPRRWYFELRHVWQDTRLIVLTAQIAAIYAAILIPFKVGIPLIPGFAELRPANAIPIVASLLFGPAAAWGAGIGNVIGDCFGTLGPASLFGFLGNFLYGYVPYLLWGNLGPLSSKKEPVIRSWRQGLEFVVVCVVASWICAATIGWGVELLGLLPSSILTPAIFFNNVVMALVLGPPLLLFLYPRVKQWGLCYSDLIETGLVAQDRRLPTSSLVRESSPTVDDASPMVSIQNLTFRHAHANTPAIRNLSLNVKRGEVVMIMGPSGSGKSSLCYALNGLIPHFVQGDYSGTVCVAGKETAAFPVWQQAGDVGIVFQDFETQLISTNVETELRFPLECFSPRENHDETQTVAEQIRTTLELVGLSGFERRDPFSLSGGQRQRLVIGSVLVRNPKLVVMDQPLTDLDPAGRRHFLTVLNRLKAQGITVILTEHEYDEVLHVDRIGLMQEGHMAWIGPPAELFRQPALAAQYGIRPHPLAECFAGFNLPQLPVTVEEAWQVADDLSVSLSLSDQRGVSSAGDHSTQDTPILELDHVTYGYDERQPVLHDVSATIYKGEFVAILGENGSGKSTLAKLFNGLLVPNEGRVTVMGLDTQVAGVGQLASVAGYVFQNPDHQIFAETVWNEVAFGAKNVGCSTEECDRRVAEALQAVRLTGAEQHDPFSLTKGERQRVAVASMLAAQPKILIFDEPTTGLDAEETARMMRMIQQLNQQGHTIVMITHTMWLVAEFSTRCVLLRKGQLIADGPTREIFSDPALLQSTALELPSITRFSQRWGVTLLTVDEVRAGLREV